MNRLKRKLKALQGARRPRLPGRRSAHQVPDTKADAPPLNMELLPRTPQQVTIPGAADGATVAGILENATVLVFCVNAV